MDRSKQSFAENQAIALRGERTFFLSDWKTVSLFLQPSRSTDKEDDCLNAAEDGRLVSSFHTKGLIKTPQ